MASLGELSVLVSAKTDGFHRSMNDVVGTAGKASKALGVVGVAVGAMATGMAAAAGAALNLVKGVAATGDEAAKASQQIGISAEAYQELGHAMNISGESIETLRKGLLRMSRNAHDAAQGVKESKEAFDEIGVSATDGAGRLKGVETLLPELADKFAGMADGTQKAAIAQDLFGKSGAKMIPFLNAGADGIAELRQEARELGIVMSNEAAAKSEEFNDTLDRLNKAFEGIKTTIGVALLPAFTEVAHIVLTVTKRVLDAVPVQEYMQQALSGMTKAAISVVRGLSEIAPVISVMGSAIGVAVNLGQIWVEGFFALNKVIVGVGATIAEFITGALSGFIGAGADLAAAVGMDGMAGALEKAEKGIASVAGAMGSVGEAAFDSLGDSVDNVAGHMGDMDDILSDLANGSTTIALRDTLASIEDGIESIGSASLETAEQFDDATNQMAGSARSLMEVLAELEAQHARTMSTRDAAIKAGEGFLDSTSTDLGKPVDYGDPTKEAIAPAERAGQSMSLAADQAAQLGGAFSALTGGIGGVIALFVDMWKSTEGFSRIMKQATDLIDSVFKPVMEGIMTDLADVLKPIFDLFKALVPVFKAALVIMSPWIVALKLVAKLFKAIAKPIQAFVKAVKTAVNSIVVFVRNIGRKKDNKAYVDSNGDIVDPKRDGEKIIIIFDEVSKAGADAADGMSEVATAAGDAVKEINGVTKTLVDAGNAFSGVFDSPLFSFGMGSGQQDVWGHMYRGIGNITDGFNSVAESANDVSESLTNIPSIFRADLRRGQAAGGGIGGSAAAAGGGGGGGVYVAGNLVVPGSTMDEVFKNIRRRNFTQYGEAYTGAAAVSALPASG